MIENEDPRIGGDYVTRVPGDAERGDLVLVGVVHDHPASEYRVRAVTGAVDPDLLALELPPLAVPLFERYAADDRTPPAFGGEMSVAIRAADGGRVVGVDGPTPAFLARTLRTLRRERASLDTLRTVLGGLVSVTKHALCCRLAAGLATATGVRVAFGDPVAHDCRRSDDPATQAADEREQVRRATAVADAFGRSDARRVRQSTRERHMAARLSALRRDGDVVAVVGAGHLDPLADLVDGRRPAPR